MPTGRCKFPEHHGQSAGQPAGLIILIIIGAVVVVYWHTVIVVLAVVAALALASGAVTMLAHARHRHEAALAELDHADRMRLAQQARAASLAQSAPAQIVYQLHLHGVTPAEMAHAVAQANAARQLSPARHEPGED